MTGRRTQPGYRSVGNRRTSGNRLTRDVTEVTAVTDTGGPVLGATHELAELLSRLAVLLTSQRPAAVEAQPTRVMPERVLLTPEEASEHLGIGRTTVYALIKSGALESVQIGRLRRIPTSAVHAYAAALVEQSRTQIA
ncbi:helix-turn-helix domain-containing protein [Pseudonocardia sp. Cha107L01]|jgi:excisionase family DNA binding protein|uniref:helix-turn-helix domain-containing protein n=1 Tax=Pseudonocardia sp. Cha107L01 TaxID=3457576 RepID=UPI00403EB1F7